MTLTPLQGRLASKDWTLPPQLEARGPIEGAAGAGGVLSAPSRGEKSRDSVRLLVTRPDGSNVHAAFHQLADFLSPGDLLVVNDSATLPAAIELAQGLVHFSTRLSPERWVVELRGMSDPGDRLLLPGGEELILEGAYRGSSRLRLGRLVGAEGPPLRGAEGGVYEGLDFLYRWGRPIRYPYLSEAFPLETYQTIFARVGPLGSAEMPSAGRAFTATSLVKLRERGVELASLTLHTGVSSLEHDEPPYPEWFSVPETTMKAVDATRARGSRVVAVGTTVVRALETAASGHSQGWTEHLVTPATGVKLVDGLLTGFHEPRATHLDMLAGIAGIDVLEGAYSEALSGGYLWHEFGDLHLLLAR